MRPRSGFLRRAAALVCVAGLLAGCSKRGSATFPQLDAAARAHLVALSAGWAAGNPALATSLSTGVLAQRDSAAAQALGAQKQAGDITDYTFDVLSITAHPLDGGASDFIAYEQIQSNDTGAISNLVELYHRSGPSAPWKAYDRAYFADNIVLPVLQLDHHGSGHLLSASQATAAKAQPYSLANQYSEAVSAISGRLPAGSFLPGVYTTGEINDAAVYVSQATAHGVGSRQWLPEPGGEAVALANGVLSFGALRQTDAIYQNSGTLDYFYVQDPKRITQSGLLAPGDYSQLTFVSLVTIAVVVTPTGLPNVVGRDEETISAQGKLSPIH